MTSDPSYNQVALIDLDKEVGSHWTGDSLDQGSQLALTIARSLPALRYFYIGHASKTGDLVDLSMGGQVSAKAADSILCEILSEQTPGSILVAEADMARVSDPFVADEEDVFLIGNRVLHFKHLGVEVASDAVQLIRRVSAYPINAYVVGPGSLPAGQEAIQDSVTIELASRVQHVIASAFDAESFVVASF